MHLFKRTLLVVPVLAGTISAAGGEYNYSDRCAPSALPPVKNPPMLVVLGSDDNSNDQGMKWIIDYLASKKHTDGTSLRMSFYVTTPSWAWGDWMTPLKTQILRADTIGHEVSNHMVTHPACAGTDWNSTPLKKLPRLSEDTILAEISTVINHLAKLGIDKKHQKGFRAPYAAYTDSTFSALVKAGLTYDCSVVEGAAEKAGSYVWPYTLDTKNNRPGLMTSGGFELPPTYTGWWDTLNGKVPLDSMEASYAPGNHFAISSHNSTNLCPIRKHSGLWELPIYALEIPNSQMQAKIDAALGYSTNGKLPGVDYNMYASAKMTRDEVLEVMKTTFDKMYAGNRSPFTFCIHTPMYVQNETGFPNIQNPADRKWVIESFIDYALSKKEVWFISGAQAINYMRKPVPASQFNPDSFLVTAPTADTSKPSSDTLSFCGFSDSQDANWLMWDMMNRINTEKPELLISTGDLWSGYSSDVWKTAISSQSSLGKLLTSGKVRVALGNHDISDNPGQAAAFTPEILPGGKEGYSFTQENCFFVSLPWVETPGDTSNAKFLREQLAKPEASKAKWRIVFAHAPVYSSNSLHTADGILCDPNDRKIDVASIRRACDEGKVDLYLGGHSHTYERSFPLAGNTFSADSFVTVQGSGTTYIVNGATGGDNSRSIAPTAKWRAVGKNLLRTYLRVDAASDTLRLVVRETSGNAVDSLKIAAKKDVVEMNSTVRHLEQFSMTHNNGVLTIGLETGEAALRIYTVSGRVIYSSQLKTGINRISVPAGISGIFVVDIAGVNGHKSQMIRF